MATVHIVPANDWEVLRKYLGDPDVILLTEDIAKENGLESTNKMEIEDYEFGGDPDHKIDMISSNNHYTIDIIKSHIKNIENEEE